MVSINGLEITKELNREFRIDRVTFVDSKKLPLIRKRLRISKRFSELEEFGWWKLDLFSTPCAAYLWYTGDPRNAQNKYQQLIHEELDILSASQLGWSKRHHGFHPRISGSRYSSLLTTAFLKTMEYKAYFFIRGKKVAAQNLVLNSKWKNFQRQRGFFLDMIKVLRGEALGQMKWRRLLKRVAIMIGKSQCSDDVAYAFLLNMIALEMLLTTHGDKYSTELPKRVDAFLGWVRRPTGSGFKEKVKTIYQKRCKLVHDGNTDDITVKDLLFTDELLFNILINLIRHPSLFQAKEDIVEFSKKLEAEAMLGIKSRVRPKSFRFISQRYQKEDYNLI